MIWIHVTILVVFGVAAGEGLGTVLNVPAVSGGHNRANGS
jgi:hypothetical protein